MEVKRCINCLKFINCFHAKKNEMLKKNKYTKNDDVVTELKICDKFQKD